VSDLQRDIEVVDSLIRGVWGADPCEHAAWQRLRARLTPDRGRLARAIHDANTNGLRGEDVWLARADAAIAAMGEP